MGAPRPSVTKRQREQVKRERALKKAEKKAERANNPEESEFGEVVRETPILPENQ
jgi:hypothetical protein